ncbi:hypothetical protein ACNJX9_04540 [Bradyrhizobium sp. DASA03076]|uniref:hypothetical protein n=1 Tax=Bradyrhizobium sp. BLXBL-03 TaxID=3395916 RepID=UPI003F6FE1DA
MLKQQKEDAGFIWFDPQLRADDPKLTAAINSFRQYLEDQEIVTEARSRRRSSAADRGFRLAVETTCCNLLVVSMVGTGTQLAVPLAHRTIWGRGAYANPAYGQHFLHLIELLEALRFVGRYQTGYNVRGRSKAPSLFVLGQGLTKHFPVGAFAQRSIRREPDAQPIILKGRKDKNGNAPLLDYRETKRTSAWHREIDRINKWLVTTNIELLADDCPLEIDEEGQVVAFFRRSLRRTFNNANWQHGGRLSGGFWMSMKRKDRFRRIRINGEQIADVDYEQLYPFLAYVRAGADMPGGDFYDVLGDRSLRKGWKILTNALLFAEKGLKNWPYGSHEHFPKEMKFKEAVELVRRKHEPIAHLFGTGVGYRLMRIESDVLIAVVSHLFRNGVPVLPLHDALLAAQSEAETVRSAMEYELAIRTGVRRATVKIEFPS